MCCCSSLVLHELTGFAADAHFRRHLSFRRNVLTSFSYSISIVFHANALCFYLQQVVRDVVSDALRSPAAGRVIVEKAHVEGKALLRAGMDEIYRPSSCKIKFS